MHKRGVGRRVLGSSTCAVYIVHVHIHVHVCCACMCVHGGHGEAIQRAWGEGEGVGGLGGGGGGMSTQCLSQYDMGGSTLMTSYQIKLCKNLHVLTYMCRCRDVHVGGV